MKPLATLAIAATVAALWRDPQSRLPAGTFTDVAVVNADGSPVAGLTTSDFELAIDGAPAPITGVTPVANAVSVAVVLDATTSQPLKRYEMNTALATQWLPSLQPTDRVNIGVVAAPLSLSGWMMPDPKAAGATARSLIDRAPIEPTPLWDAAIAAVDTLTAERNVKLVLIVSDGRSTANRLGLDDVADRASKAGVVVSSVGEGGERLLAQAGDPVARVRPDASLQWLADETGGMYLPDGVARRTMRPQQDPFAYVRELIATPSRPGPLMVQLTSAMRQRYRLAFPAPSDSRPHRLELRVNVPNVTAHWARRLLR